MYEWVEVFGKEGRVAKRQREKMGGRKREREREITLLCDSLVECIWDVGGQQRLWSRKELGGTAESE